MNKLKETYFKIPIHIKRSLLRFFLSFFAAWFLSILFNDLPVFSNIIKASNIDFYLQNLLVWLTELILNLLNFDTWSEGKRLLIIGHSGIRFEYSCLGIRHIILFTSFILIYYGKLLDKLWFIPVGILTLIVINSIRAVIISIGQYINDDATLLVHDISTPILMYSTILFLWIYWVNRDLKLKE